MLAWVSSAAGPSRSCARLTWRRRSTKAAWTARSAATLGVELAEAVRTALSGRPGPVHLSLPFDLLEETVEEAPALWPEASAFAPEARPLEDTTADAILKVLGDAERPLVLAGPQLCHSGDLSALRELEEALTVPVVAMESPRGVNDPRLGAFAEVLRQADLIVLLGKALRLHAALRGRALRRCRLPLRCDRCGCGDDRSRRP